MLWTLATICFVLWVLGLAGVYAIGTWIWLLFAIWVISLIAQIASGRGRGNPTVQQRMWNAHLFTTKHSRSKHGFGCVVFVSNSQYTASLVTLSLRRRPATLTLPRLGGARVFPHGNPEHHMKNCAVLQPSTELLLPSISERKCICVETGSCFLDFAIYGLRFFGCANVGLRSEF
jgi:hypothetical protein